MNKLKSHYQKLKSVSPKQELRNKIMETCGVNEATVYRWLNGTVVPGKLQKEAIAKVIGIAVYELFPEDNPSNVKAV